MKHAIRFVLVAAGLTLIVFGGYYVYRFGDSAPHLHSTNPADTSVTAQPPVLAVAPVALPSPNSLQGVAVTPSRTGQSTAPPATHPSTVQQQAQPAALRSPASTPAFSPQTAASPAPTQSSSLGLQNVVDTVLGTASLSLGL